MDENLGTVTDETQKPEQPKKKRGRQKGWNKKQTLGISVQREKDEIPSAVQIPKHIPADKFVEYMNNERKSDKKIE